MSLPNDSIPINPETAAVLPILAAGGYKIPVVMPADMNGQVLGSRPVYFFQVPNQVHVAAAATIHWDLFNAHATKLVRVRGIYQIPDILTVVTGVATSWRLARTTAVGTGGAALTAWLPDTAQAALDATITCRSKPAGGATEGTVLNDFVVSSEETSVPAQLVAVMAAAGLWNLVPPALRPPHSEHGILLRRGQGISVTQKTNSAQGNTGWLIEFTTE